jgi:hypothetical protein
MENDKEDVLRLKKKDIITLDNKKLASMGPDTVIIIPRKMVKYNVIDPDKRYNVYLEEVKEK